MILNETDRIVIGAALQCGYLAAERLAEIYRQKGDRGLAMNWEEQQNNIAAVLKKFDVDATGKLSPPAVDSPELDPAKPAPDKA